jgi:hypothetical protein
MKHVNDYNNLNERKKYKDKILHQYKLHQYQKYDPDNDDFLREVWSDKTIPQYILEGKKYRLYAEFETGAMISGKCYVILTDHKEFIGLDSDYFLEDYQWVASKKYNI